MADIGKGCVHIYTGNGKGKTTAAFGLALRAAGRDLSVSIIQFAKGQVSGESIAVNQCLSDRINLQCFGSDCLINTTKDPSQRDIDLASDALKASELALRCGDYEMVVLDEIIVAAYMGLFDESAIFRIIEYKPDGVELILTGRYASDELIKRVDLVTEMVEVKHYYEQGVLARRGIED